MNQAFAECRSNDGDVIGAVIKICSQPADRAMKLRVCTSNTNGSQRLGPEISDFQNKWHSFQFRNPTSGKTDEQLWRCGNDYVWTCEKRSCQRSRGAKRTVIEHPLIRFTIGKGQQPRADHINTVNFFAPDTAAELFAIVGANYAIRMIGKSCEHGHIVAGLHPVPGEFGNAGRRRTHLWREILRYVKDLQRGLSNSKA